jgi:probable addiction module antidote protein
MAVETTLWDVAEHIDSPEHVAAYLSAAFEDGDPALIAHAIGAVTRSRGMSELARRTGLSRESLYRSLSADGNPSFATVVAVLKELGMQLYVEAAAQNKAHANKARERA